MNETRRTPVVILPALEPDSALTGLVQSLSPIPAVVVDDGSGPDYAPLFKELECLENCIVLFHPVNRGKGAALKTAMKHVLTYFPDCPGIITADADGQHTSMDISRVMEALRTCPGSFTLGVRDFSKENVPWRSRWGNRITSMVFRLSAGVPCPDTQTGLRGVPKSFIPHCLEIPGDRYEYEMNQLMTFARQKIPFHHVAISTIYLEGNRSSHFHAFRDSLRIYASVLRFALSSGLSALVDLSFFTVASMLIPLFPATILARFLSGGLNFFLNKNWVFSAGSDSALFKYLLLFCCQMIASGLLVTWLAFLFPYVLPVKILVDGSLFLVSYHIQKNFIFVPRKRPMNI